MCCFILHSANIIVLSGVWIWCSCYAVCIQIYHPCLLNVMGHKVKGISVYISFSVSEPWLRWDVFCRWLLAQRPEWGGEHRPCLALAASARAGSPPSGDWTLPQRRRQKPIPLSTRSLAFSFHFFLFSFEARNRNVLLNWPFPQVCILHSSAWAMTLDVCLSAGFCWWWRAGQKVCRWHICWWC